MMKPFPCSIITTNFFCEWHCIFRPRKIQPILHILCKYIGSVNIKTFMLPFVENTSPPNYKLSFRVPQNEWKCQQYHAIIKSSLNYYMGKTYYKELWNTEPLKRVFLLNLDVENLQIRRMLIWFILVNSYVQQFWVTSLFEAFDQEVTLSPV